MFCLHLKLPMLTAKLIFYFIFFKTVPYLDFPISFSVLRSQSLFDYFPPSPQHPISYQILLMPPLSIFKSYPPCPYQVLHTEQAPPPTPHHLSLLCASGFPIHCCQRSSRVELLLMVLPCSNLVVNKIELNLIKYNKL